MNSVEWIWKTFLIGPSRSTADWIEEHFKDKFNPLINWIKHWDWRMPFTTAFFFITMKNILFSFTLNTLEISIFFLNRIPPFNFRKVIQRNSIPNNNRRRNPHPSLRTHRQRRRRHRLSKRNIVVIKWFSNITMDRSIMNKLSFRFQPAKNIEQVTQNRDESRLYWT